MMENVKHPIATIPPALNVSAHDIKENDRIRPLQRLTEVELSLSMDSLGICSQGVDTVPTQQLPSLRPDTITRMKSTGFIC
jgi:hypothetical protein